MRRGTASFLRRCDLNPQVAGGGCRSTKRDPKHQNRSGHTVSSQVQTEAGSCNLRQSFCTGSAVSFPGVPGAMAREKKRSSDELLSASMRFIQSITGTGTLSWKPAFVVAAWFQGFGLGWENRG